MKESGRMAEERESIRQFSDTAGDGTDGHAWRRGPEWLSLLGTFVAIVTVSMLCLGVLTVVAGRAPHWLWGLLGSSIAAALTLFYVRRHQPEPEPAMDEARLMALTARIRPHFLFNSLNAVIATIRSDPRQAETALEEMAELFRALMHDPRELVPLSDEIALCRKYLALEKLRLGDRIQVQWDIDACPPDALMPPLMLQPLLENAVYHGIEPMENPGPIKLRLLVAGSMLVVELTNPHETRHSHAKGNRMALSNIRERLSLFFGDAAYLNAEVKEGRYELRIVLPYQRRIV